jgi:hypothetical protein
MNSSIATPAAQTFTYVDNSNLFLEGQRVSAVAKGMACSIIHAMNAHITDYDWNLDYGRLHDLLCGDDREVGCARLWGSPPPGDSFWRRVEQRGWKVQIFERALDNREKKVDVAVAHQMTKDAYTVVRPGVDWLTLVSGDKDYVPVVADLVAQGHLVEIAFWDQAARELKEVATRFTSLNRFHALITRGRV